MNITRRTRSDVVILDLSGRMTAADGTALSRTVQAVLREGQRKILLNLGGLTLMDSSGLGELTAAKTTATGSGAALYLLHVEDKVREVMSLANALNSFRIFDEEGKAVSAFR